jgi:hypothetical protein
MALVIKNGKNTQSLTFGYSCLKALGEKWDIPGVQSVVNHVFKSFSIFFDEKGNPIEVTDIPFDIMELICDIISAASGEEDFNGLTYGDFIFENMDQLGKVLESFIKSLPQEKKQIASMKK